MATKYYDIVQSDDISVPQSRVEGLLEHTYIPTKSSGGSGSGDGGDKTYYIQNKTVTSSFGDQLVKPDSGYDYLGQVKVLKMPVSREKDTDGGIIITIGKDGSSSSIGDNDIIIQKVAYIQSPGNSSQAKVIDVPSSTDYWVHAEYWIPTNTNYFNQLINFGEMGSIVYYSGKLELYAGNNGYTYHNNPQLGIKHSYDVRKDWAIWVDGNKIYDLPNHNSVTNSNTCYLCYRSDSGNWPGVFRLYDLKIYRMSDNVLVYDFQPSVIKYKDNVLVWGLFEAINGEFYDLPVYSYSYEG